MRIVMGNAESFDEGKRDDGGLDDDNSRSPRPEEVASDDSRSKFLDFFSVAAPAPTQTPADVELGGGPSSGSTGEGHFVTPEKAAGKEEVKEEEEEEEEDDEEFVDEEFVVEVRAVIFVRFSRCQTAATVPSPSVACPTVAAAAVHR